MFSWLKRLAAPLAVVALLSVAPSVFADTVLVSFYTEGTFGVDPGAVPADTVVNGSVGLGNVQASSLTSRIRRVIRRRLRSPMVARRTSFSTPSIRKACRRR